MLRIAVLVSGGGTNLQAIIDRIEDGTIRNTEIAMVISNNKNAKALERAAKHHIPAQCISPKDFENRDMFNKVLSEFEGGSYCAGRIYGRYPAGDDPKLQKPDHQYSSVTYSVFLRNRLLRSSCA